MTSPLESSLLHSLHNPKEFLFQPKTRCLARYSSYSFAGKIYSATRKQDVQHCLKSPVREEFFHFLGDWQC